MTTLGFQQNDERQGAGMTRRRHTYEAPELASFLRRMARAMGRRCAEGDLEALSALVDAQRSIEQAIGDGARALHGFGYSWTEIGRELGTTRQNARQRFGREGGNDEQG